MVLIMVFSVIFVLLSYLILAQTPNLQKNKNKNFFPPPHVSLPPLALETVYSL